MLDFADFVASTNDKKNPLAVTSVMPQHPTGFMYLDYGCGSYLNVYDDNEVPLFTYHNIGITSGSVNVLLSKSQGGKTSLAIAMGNAIIEPYINKMYYDQYVKSIMSENKIKEIDETGMPFIQIADTEKTLPMDFVKKLTHLGNKELKRRVMINPITTDKELIQLVEKHILYKVQTMNPAVSPILDLYGKPIMEYPPTILIIDSTSQLILEDVDDPSKIGTKNGLEAAYDSATKGPAGAQRAKVISALYSQLVNYAKRYNIIIFSINHINKMPAIMGIPVKQYRGLRAGETIGGGERAIYLASSMLRLDVIKSIGAATSTSLNLGDGITGHIAIASWIKSKSNSKSNSCQLAYTNINGYDPLLSALYYGKETGDLAKKGNYFYVNKHPDQSFTLKNYQDVFAENPELFSAYYDQLRDQCSKMLDNPDNAIKRNKKMMNEIRQDIHDEAANGEYDRNTAHDLDDIFANMVND